MSEIIATPCPSCGGKNLFIGTGGHLTCSLIGCKEPVVETAIDKLKREDERAWDSARFFAGRNELLRLHIRYHLGLTNKACIGWGDDDYRDALERQHEK